MKGVALGLIAFTLLATTARADIFAWDGADGVRHYTNLKEDVPSRQAPEVVVDEHVWVPHDSALPVSEEDPVAPADPPRDTEDAVLRAFLAGLESGRASDSATGGSVYLNGPLAVAVSPPAPYGTFGLPGYGFGLPGYDWLLPGYVPFVTTAVIGRHHRSLHGRFGNHFHSHFPLSGSFVPAAGPPPFGAAGPPPFGAAGRPPFGAAGPPPFGVTRSGFPH